MIFIPAAPIFLLLSMVFSSAQAAQATQKIRRRWVPYSHIATIAHRGLPPAFPYQPSPHLRPNRREAPDEAFIAAALSATGAGDISGGKVVFIATETQSDTPGATESGAKWVEVFETSTDIPSSLGNLTETCMTLVQDQTQRFCSTFLNGQNLGSDSGLQVASSAPVSMVSSASSLASSTSSPDPAATSSPAGVSTTGSASTTSLSTNSVSVDVVVNDAPSSNSALGQSTPALASTPSGGAISSTVSTPGISSTAQPPTSSATESSASSPLSISSASSNVTAAATAQAAQETSSTVAIPGQKLSVLPIGLGVFGGLAGITLIIVGYVLWERKKYRIQFRRRKDAEKGGLSGRGAAMGTYGSA